MSRQLEEIKIVTAIKSPMLKKLRDNGHKEHWRESSINSLIKILEGEVQELKDKLLEMDLEEAKRECAGIAIVASMIYDNIDQKFFDKKNINSKPSFNIKTIVDSFFSEVYEKAKRGGKAVICGRLDVTVATISRWRGEGGSVPRIDVLDQMWSMVMEARNEAEEVLNENNNR